MYFRTLVSRQAPLELLGCVNIHCPVLGEPRAAEGEVKWWLWCWGLHIGPTLWSAVENY